MEQSVYLECENIQSLRYKIFSTDLSTLSQYEADTLNQINSYLNEQISLCTDVQRITFSSEELEVISVVLEGEVKIDDIKDLKKLKQL